MRGWQLDESVHELVAGTQEYGPASAGQRDHYLAARLTTAGSTSSMISPAIDIGQAFQPRLQFWLHNDFQRFDSRSIFEIYIREVSQSATGA